MLLEASFVCEFYELFIPENIFHKYKQTIVYLSVVDDWV